MRSIELHKAGEPGHVTINRIYGECISHFRKVAPDSPLIEIARAARAHLSPKAIVDLEQAYKMGLTKYEKLFVLWMSEDLQKDYPDLKDKRHCTALIAKLQSQFPRELWFTDAQGDHYRVLLPY